MHETLLIIHILAAATWIGGSLTIMFLSRRLRANSHEAGAGLMEAFMQMGKMYFPPAAVVLLLTGILLVLDSSDHGFEDAFVAIGIAVVIAGAFLGIKVFGPLAQQAKQGHDEKDDAAVDRAYRRFARFGVLELALLTFAVVAMVTTLGS